MEIEDKTLSGIQLIGNVHLYVSSYRLEGLYNTPKSDLPPSSNLCLVRGQNLISDFFSNSQDHS